jgi:hypothetical protein
MGLVGEWQGYSRSMTMTMVGVCGTVSEGIEV